MSVILGQPTWCILCLLLNNAQENVNQNIFPDIEIMGCLKMGRSTSSVNKVYSYPVPDTGKGEQIVTSV